MSPIKIVICDDEYTSITQNKNILTGYLEARGIPYELDCFDDGMMCLEHLAQHPVDLLLLDIFLNAGQMGTELARQLRRFNQEAKLIFLSSSNEFATESFEVNASYYLLKPLTPEKLAKAMAKCGITVTDIQIDTGREVISLNPAAVVALEAQNKYTVVYTVNGPLRFLCPLAKFTERLHEPDFLSTHRSFVINLRQVAYYDEDYFYMSNGFKAPMTSKNSKALRDAYIKWAINNV